jgi:pimeloyl-ACP methyl ester carboxylesterase
MKKTNWFLFLQIIICLLVITGCQEKKVEEEPAPEYVFPEEYYPDYSTINYANGRGYEFKNENSNKLIITLDGGPDWSSIIGEPGERMEGYRFIEWLLPMQNEYNFFVPEKFNREPGNGYYHYFYILSEREHYTVDNLLKNYLEVINEYLSQNNYESIIIIGYSEGGVILPMLYLQLDNNEKITALISVAGGGLSMFEDYQIFFKKTQTGEKPFNVLELRNMMEFGIVYESALNAYREEPYPDSINRVMLFRSTSTYRWMTSIIHKRPFDYYTQINIPVLFRQGERDMQTAVESTKYVEDNLPDKPFEYIYDADMGHYPTSVEELERLRADIANWLREKGL